jgi:hypothetical protein
MAEFLKPVGLQDSREWWGRTPRDCVYRIHGNGGVEHLVIVLICEFEKCAFFMRFTSQNVPR